MKLKKLKEVTILNHRVQIEWNKKEGGGWFNLGTKDGYKMGIGCNSLKHSPEETYAILMHELSEVIHCILGTRSHNTSNNSFVFMFDHAGFEIHNRVLTSAYMKFFK